MFLPPGFMYTQAAGEGQGICRTAHTHAHTCFTADGIAGVLKLISLIPLTIARHAAAFVNMSWDGQGYLGLHTRMHVQARACARARGRAYLHGAHYDRRARLQLMSGAPRTTGGQLSWAGCYTGLWRHCINCIDLGMSLTYMSMYLW